jgi:hypothetical protein
LEKEVSDEETNSVRDRQVRQEKVQNLRKGGKKRKSSVNC